MVLGLLLVKGKCYMIIILTRFYLLHEDWSWVLKKKKQFKNSFSSQFAISFSRVKLEWRNDIHDFDSKIWNNLTCHHNQCKCKWKQ